MSDCPGKNSSPAPVTMQLTRHQRQLLDAWKTTHPDQPAPFIMYGESPVWQNRKARKAHAAKARLQARHAKQPTESPADTAKRLEIAQKVLGQDQNVTEPSPNAPDKP